MGSRQNTALHAQLKKKTRINKQDNEEDSHPNKRSQFFAWFPYLNQCSDIVLSSEEVARSPEERPAMLWQG